MKDSIILGGVLLLFGVLIIYKALKDFKASRKVQDTAKSNIKSAPMGLVEIEGYAWPAGEMVRDRFHNWSIYLDYRLEKLVKRGKNSSWETVFKFRHETPFFVMDGTAICLVDPHSDHMQITTQTTKLSGYPRNHEELLQMANQKPSFIVGLFSNPYRIVERKILMGSQVYACGSMQPAGSNKYHIYGDYKKFLNQIKAFKISPILQLQKLDINRDGKLTDNEKNQGLCKIATECKVETAEQINLSGIISDAPDHELIVSDCHQEELLKRLSSFNNFKIVAGVLMIGLALYIFKSM